MNKSISILFSLLIVNSSVLAEESLALITTGSTKPKMNDGFFQEKSNGWFWYKDPEKEVINEEKKSQEPVVGASSPSSKEVLRARGEKLEESLATAMLNPTRENIVEYLKQMQEAQQMAQTLSSNFMQTLWVNPEYDYTLERPTHQRANIAKNLMTHEQEVSRLKAIAQEKVILFFFRSDCPYCHALSPILRRFADDYGYTIMPVTVDGGNLPDFTNPRMSSNLASKLNVSTVPALFLVDPVNDKVSTIGYGYQDYTALEKKILFAADQYDKSEPARIGDVR